MKKPPLAIACVFDKNGEEAAALVLRSYRLYLRRRLGQTESGPDRREVNAAFYSGIDEFRQK